MKKLSPAKIAAICALLFAMPGIAEEFTEERDNGRPRSLSSPAAIQITLPASASPVPSRVLEKPLVPSHSMFSEEAERRAFLYAPQASIPFGFYTGAAGIPYPLHK